MKKFKLTLKCRQFIWLILFTIILSGCEKKEEYVISSDEKISLVESTLESRDIDDLKEDALISVYVCGEVKHPGVYTLKKTARMNDAVKLAGGMTKRADQNAVNLASKLEDEQQVIIPKKGNRKEKTEEETDVSENSDSDKQKVDINTASKEELMKLSGIGQSRAEAILAYRQEHGRFQKIEEIMNVSGIKEAAFSKIKEQIIVKN